MRRRTIESLLIIGLAASGLRPRPARADHAFPPFDLSVSGPTTFTLPTAGLEGTYGGFLITANWSPVLGEAWSSEAQCGLTHPDQQVVYAPLRSPVNGQASTVPLRLCWVGALDRPYVGGEPLAIVARQTYPGSIGLWSQVTVALLDEDPLRLDHLSRGVLAADMSVAASTSDALPVLYGRDGYFRDPARLRQGWEAGRDHVYTVLWPGGDFGAVLQFSASAGDLDLFLWGDPHATSLVGESCGVGGHETLRVPGLAPGTYYMHIDGWNGAVNAYTMCLPAPYPVADYTFSNARNAFSNLGPNDTYRESPDYLNGYQVTFASAGDYYQQAQRIVPTVSGYLTELAVAIHMDGTAYSCAADNAVRLELTTSVGDLPGAVLETLLAKEQMDVAELPATNRPIYVTARGATWLAAGESYWLIASHPGPHSSSLTWAWNNCGEAGGHVWRGLPDPLWIDEYCPPWDAQMAVRVVVADRAVHARPGDVNCDGLIDFYDINPFVLYLTGGPAAYTAQYPGCPLLNGDCNVDAAVDFSDINPFVALLLPR